MSFDRDAPFEERDDAVIAFQAAESSPVLQDNDGETASLQTRSTVSEDDADEGTQEIMNQPGTELHAPRSASSYVPRLLPDVDDQDLSKGVKSVIKFKW